MLKQPQHIYRKFSEESHTEKNCENRCSFAAVITKEQSGCFLEHGVHIEVYPCFEWQRDLVVSAYKFCYLQNILTGITFCTNMYWHAIRPKDSICNFCYTFLNWRNTVAQHTFLGFWNMHTQNPTTALPFIFEENIYSYFLSLPLCKSKVTWYCSSLLTSPLRELTCHNGITQR